MTPLQLNQLQRVVAFGGGHGLGRLLSTLTFLGDRLCGIVATTDDGGSTGRLRRQTGCIAWGDLRNCLNQICTQPTLPRLLFEYRFVEGEELAGHNLGNLILLALDQLTARPVDALNLIRDLLEVEPHLLPMSEEATSLEGEDESGARASGESAVEAMDPLPNRLWLEPAVGAPEETLAAIKQAELILLGPGSFLTSVMPSLLVTDIAEALAAAHCPRILIANLIAEPAAIGRLDLAQQLRWMEQILGQRVIDRVLWPAERGAPPPLDLPLHIAPLASAAEPGRHQRSHLIEALENMLAK